MKRHAAGERDDGTDLLFALICARHDAIEQQHKRTNQLTINFWNEENVCERKKEQERHRADIVKAV